MSLTAENLKTQEGYIYPPTIEEDLMQMDERQLFDYAAAVLEGRYFRAYESIAFLPESMRLDRERNFAHRIARLFADAGAAESDQENLDPDFRNRLLNILIGFLSVAAEGGDVLEQLGHTPDHPRVNVKGEPIPEEYLDWHRTLIIQGCIDIVSAILYKDSPMESSVNAIFDSIPDGESITIDEFNDRAAEEVEVSIKPEHMQLLLLVRQLMEIPGYQDKITYGNIILGILSDLSDAEQ